LRGKKKRKRKSEEKSKPDLSCWWSGYISQQDKDFRKSKDQITRLHQEIFDCPALPKNVERIFFIHTI
jgi:hypothetical protein